MDKKVVTPEIQTVLDAAVQWKRAFNDPFSAVFASNLFTAVDAYTASIKPSPLEVAVEAMDAVLGESRFSGLCDNVFRRKCWQKSGACVCRRALQAGIDAAEAARGKE